MSPPKKKLKTEYFLPNDFKRPNFSSLKRGAAKLEAEIALNKSLEKKYNLAEHDLAAPHRIPYSYLRDLVSSDNPQKKTPDDFLQKIKSMFNASKTYEKALSNVKNVKVAQKCTTLAGLYKQTRENAEKAFNSYEKDKSNANPQTLKKLKETLVKSLNNLASNAPGLGPHTTTNLPVLDRGHLNPTGDSEEPLTPRGAVIKNFPDLKVATKKGEDGQEYIVNPRGGFDLLSSNMGIAKTEEVKAQQVTEFRGSLACIDGVICRPNGRDNQGNPLWKSLEDA